MTPGAAPGVTEVPLGIDILQRDLFRRNPAFRTLPAGREPCFVNAFAGCGGLALGLVRAGWTGLLAIEERQAAWETLSANLLHLHAFAWPADIECRAWSLGSLLATHRGTLASLAGNVDLLAGAVPCSPGTAPEDPANRIWQDFLSLADMLRPAAILIESMPAFVRSPRNRGSGRTGTSFAGHFQESLPGYDAAAALLDAGAFGVPQRRRRVWVIATRNDLDLPVQVAGFFDRAGRDASLFLHERGLPPSPTAEEAIGDLETDGNSVPAYGGPRTAFQDVMHRGCNDEPADRRLTRHSHAVQAQYRKAISRAQRPTGTKKAGKEGPGRPTRVLERSRPAPPVPASPEDLLHYAEPRTLTVREAARLQTFPDEFAFHGVHTASGTRRNRVMPRYA